MNNMTNQHLSELNINKSYIFVYVQKTYNN